MDKNKVYIEGGVAGEPAAVGRLHPVWSYLLMTLCVHTAMLVGVYALFERGLIRALGLVVVAALVWAAALVYRTA